MHYALLGFTNRNHRIIVLDCVLIENRYPDFKYFFLILIHIWPCKLFILAFQNSANFDFVRLKICSSHYYLYKCSLSNKKSACGHTQPPPRPRRLHPCMLPQSSRVTQHPWKKPKRKGHVLATKPGRRVLVKSFCF